MLFSSVQNMYEGREMEKTISETIAGALFYARVRVLTYVPGSGANEVFTDFNRISKIQHPVSFHEEAAYSIAHGAALAGTRSASLMKSHGFLKAGNSISDSLYSGTTAGFITVVVNDESGKHSDSIMDVEAFLHGIGIPYEKADLEHLYTQILRLFEQSEKRSLPYALVVESHHMAQRSAAQDWRKPDGPSPVYRRDIFQHVLNPFLSEYQYTVLQYKNEGRDWSLIPRPTVPRLPDDLPDKWKPIITTYSGLFSIFQSIRGSLVTGDAGVAALFAFEPFNCIDITTYMGGSIPLAVGAYLGGRRDIWAVTGDFSFIAAGYLGLLEARQRQIPLKVLIFYNGTAETTGGQPIPENTLETLLNGYNEYVRLIHDPQNRSEIEFVLNEAGSSNEMRIVLADYRNVTKNQES
jgi:TPP-dependent indolepyruvate ferredoxin oxidoreductase alpha subunit